MVVKDNVPIDVRVCVCVCMCWRCAGLPVTSRGRPTPISTIEAAQNARTVLSPCRGRHCSLSCWVELEGDHHVTTTLREAISGSLAPRNQRSAQSTGRMRSVECLTTEERHASAPRMSVRSGGLLLEGTISADGLSKCISRDRQRPCRVPLGVPDVVFWFEDRDCKTQNPDCLQLGIKVVVYAGHELAGRICAKYKTSLGFLSLEAVGMAVRPPSLR